MQTYEEIKKTLNKLEEIYFRRLSESFIWQKSGDFITGAIQYGALDHSFRKTSQRMPVIGTYGINYSNQVQYPASIVLYSYIGGATGPEVEQNTRCLKPVAHILCAYNRNTNAWISASTPWPSGTKGATAKSGLRSTNARSFQGDFVMFMVNRSSFITKFRWQDQVKTNRSDCEELLRRWPNDKYLDELSEELNGAVDLWIGHSARNGTHWVWPAFNAFLQRHQIKEWLFTPNISFFTSSHVPNYGKSSNRLYQFFKP